MNDHHIQDILFGVNISKKSYMVRQGMFPLHDKYTYSRDHCLISGQHIQIVTYMVRPLYAKHIQDTTVKGQLIQEITLW